MFAFIVIVIISFIRWCLLFHYYQNVAPDRKKIPAPRENYPVPDPTRFLDPGPDRSPNKAKYGPVTRIGSGLHGPVRGSPTVRGAPLVFISYKIIYT